MVSIYDVNPQKLMEEVAKKMAGQKLVQPPQWSSYVKTGSNKERPPARKDWWFVRAASVLRTVHKLGPVGTEKLRTKYGGLKNRGFQPEIYKKAGGSIIRKILQQLEKAELIKKTEKGVHKGRVITPKGRSLLNKSVLEILKQNGKTQVKGKEDKAGQESKSD